MPEENAAAPVEAEGAGSQGEAEAKPSGDYWEQEAKRAIAKRDELKARLREVEARDKEAQQEAAQRSAQQGQYKEAYEALLAKYEAEAPKLTEHEHMAAYFSERVEHAVGALPDDLREAVPESLSPVERLKLAERLSQYTTKKPTAPPVPNTPAPGPGNTPPPYGTPEYVEWMRKAPIEEVRESRKNWWQRRQGGGG